MGKIDMGIFYGKLYNSHNRTFSIINGEKFIDETGPFYKHVLFNLLSVFNFEHVNFWQREKSHKINFKHEISD